ncbi:metal ABC transporter permease [Schaalia sp. 19OD2882]|uniref:metal ABC transporter permease n=1 Tax=Schaalia sp. 19OD2882 TaxID=2794089 RepID=UPI001C1EB806|nr:iron chelate uptake ABC transporter family permease subunit [Schaalia sp. 19OD2882]QWW20010.1 metal ABC transporter permease [Schaalia sp. 19OD2882]
MTPVLLDILRLPILEVVAVGALCGLVGALAVMRGRVFFAESVTHGTFPGAVLGVVVGAALGADQQSLSVWLFAGAFAMCVPLAWLMRGLSRIRGISPQAAAGIVLTFGFALGYFLAKWFAPLPLQITSFLTGSLLHVNVADVAAAATVLALATALVVFRGRHLVALSFDEDGFRAHGGRVELAEGAILALVVLTTVVVIPAVGTVLSLALLAAPAASLKPWAPSALSLVVWSPLLGAGLGLLGLGVAVIADLSAGGTIAVLAGITYLGATGAHRFRLRIAR